MDCFASEGRIPCSGLCDGEGCQSEGLAIGIGDFGDGFLSGGEVGGGDLGGGDLSECVALVEGVWYFAGGIEGALEVSDFGLCGGDIAAGDGRQEGWTGF